MKSFSALQRAENSSRIVELDTRITAGSFSALQRAENSSQYHAVGDVNAGVVSVLFSEPKIPHNQRNAPVWSTPR